jgi:hypothetical protein
MMIKIVCINSPQYAFIHRSLKITLMVGAKVNLCRPQKKSKRHMNLLIITLFLKPVYKIIQLKLATIF